MTNRGGSRSNRLLYLAVLSLLFCKPVFAGAIYDVVITYEGGFTYQFSMEFADATGLKTQLDLTSSAPERDFQDEQFFRNGTPWVLGSDRNLDDPLDSLSFDPATSALSFAHYPPAGGGDTFSIVDASFPTGAGCATIYGNGGGGFSSLQAGTCGGTNTIRTLSTSVTLRDAAIPEPSALALLGLGLAGLGWSRRRK